MTKRFTGLFFILILSIGARAQYESYVQVGEIGVAVGGAHYFGDLNTSSAVSRPKIAIGGYFLKQFNNFVGIKLSGNFIQLGYSDVYAKNVVQRRRNLSFNTNIWEASASAYFNFFQYIPGVEGYNYTPYVSLGGGVFTFDPYAYYRGEKVMLRTLGTEGQGSPQHPGRKVYKPYAFCFPVSVGFKYSFSNTINLYAELSYRFTNTDYLDDVSTTYTPEAFKPNSLGAAMFDRSYETGDPIGIAGRQRGNSTQKDSYAVFQIGLSFNLSSYACPTY